MAGGVKAGDYIDIFEKFWKLYFGIPDLVRTDPEGAWRSHEVTDYFERRGIQWECIPAEAHWNLTHVERTIGWVKEFLTKMAMQEEESTYEELLTHAIYTWNHRETVRGYSPFQHALGRQPTFL